jgi:polysaccharide biosynthesis transport protein
VHISSPNLIEVASASSEQTPAKAPAVTSPLQMLHRLLRGHYLLLILLVAVVAATGGVIGWRLPVPSYRSDALIQIRYYQQPDPTSSAPFDVFMQTQQTLITSRRVVDQAMREKEWTELGRATTPAVLQEFASNLLAEAKPRTEYLKISYIDNSPVIAAAAVRAVTKAYVQIFSEDEQLIKGARLKTLSKERAECSARIEAAQLAVAKVVQEFGSSDLAPLHDLAIQRAARLSLALEELHLQMATGGGAAPAVLPSGAPAPVEVEVQPAAANATSPEAIARNDAVMREYLGEQRKLGYQLDALKLQGFGDSYRDVVQVRNALQKANDRVQEYAKEFRTVQQVGRRAGTSTDPAGIATVIKSPAEMLAEETKINALYDREKRDMVTLETTRLETDRLRSSLQKYGEELDAINKKISGMAEQDQMGGRLTIINAGEVPLQPMRDLRWKLSAAGALAGASLPIGLFALLGLVRRRYLYTDEAIEDITPKAALLGILPALVGAPGESGFDAEQAAGAAQRVHQIRVMLEVGRQGRRGMSYLITSASAGEGKTSLTMSLGLSFAASGLRTLVIDGDLVGQQVTRGMEADDMPGLSEALRAGSLRGCVRRTMAGLYVLPVGRAAPMDACAVSAGALRALMDVARRHFDVILVDSGPILGSIEASLLAPDVDNVVLTVVRGQQPQAVDRAMERLNSLGAKVCGFVFNRAESRDYQRSSYESSSRSRTNPDNVIPGNLSRRPSRFGPLVEAVASSLPGHYERSLS